MRVDVQLFGLPATEYAPLVVHAERLGFDTVWLADHVITPARYAPTYPYRSSGDPGIRPDTPLSDVTVTLGHLAARTSRIRLGTGVLIAPLRDPFHLARAWASLQQLSAGRAVLGLGVGWMAEEFAALGVDFGTRGARTDEMLRILDLLWSGEPVAHQGRFFDFPTVHFGPSPQPPVPVVVGGHSPAALRRAARHGAGWFGPDVDLATSARLCGQLAQLREQVGRADDDFTCHVRLHGAISVATVRAYRDAGLDHLVVAPFTRLPPAATRADRLAALDSVAERLASLWPDPASTGHLAGETR
ncbi:TIGR03619 family F420-dependent LLM class oxidoreductase [Solwaraspora sp. WMMA2101]|uniref:TIGR03619 family F420-dependent LLM class oxidoreductase n=1 Tax=Solwaraspora sp. WMMA2101 TaxID=3404124 RepID=UPI003B9564A0